MAPHYLAHLDLISVEGKIANILDPRSSTVEVLFQNVNANFKGFYLPNDTIEFIIKSSLSQLGINSKLLNIDINRRQQKIVATIQFFALSQLGKKLLPLVTEGLYVGKLFSRQLERRIRSYDYINRLFHKTDKQHRHLFSLADNPAPNEYLYEDKKHKRIIAKIPIKTQFYLHSNELIDIAPAIIHLLKKSDNDISIRAMISDYLKPASDEEITNQGFVLIQTQPNTLQTLYARVAYDLLPKNISHIQATILTPNTIRNRNIFAFFSSNQNFIESLKSVSSIPLEFYSLESFRESFQLSDRKLYQLCANKPATLFAAFKTAPKETRASIFIAKGSSLINIKQSDWIAEDDIDRSLVIPPKTENEKKQIISFIEKQSIYPILKAIEESIISSEGIIITKYFPPTILKSLLLHKNVRHQVKGIYFKEPSKKYEKYFSHEDRQLLLDLAKAGIEIFWVNEEFDLLLIYALRSDGNSGMFIPIDMQTQFNNAVFFGIYGSRFQLDTAALSSIKEIFSGLLKLQEKSTHPEFNKSHFPAIVTGGGPGIMELANKTAKELNILSLANVVNFSKQHESGKKIDLEPINPFIQGIMTYRIEQIVVRQNEFQLDFPIFFPGGIGTDFEFALEALLLQVRAKKPRPIILFGKKSYWKSKITHTFKKNLEIGSIIGTEWITQYLFQANTVEDVLKIYKQYFDKKINFENRKYPLGFRIPKKL